MARKLGIALALIFFCLPFTSMKGQTKEVQKIEVEARVGLTTPVGGYHGGTAQVSAALGLEGRYNFSGTPWDCGIMLELTTARRGFNNLFNDTYDRWQSNRTLIIGVTGDYNLRQGSKFNPYAGLGLGLGINDVVGDKYFPSKGKALFVSPRIGIELWRHMRVGAQLNLGRRGYNNLSISVGVVFGGR